MGRPAVEGQGKMALFDEEDIPRPSTRVQRHVLDTWSVADLRDYIGDLQAEIARAEAAIGAKEGARGHADSFFRVNKES